MEQKRAMLYPDPNNISIEERHSATEALGLPTGPPPSYAVAVSTDQNQFSQSNQIATIHEDTLPKIVSNSQPTPQTSSQRLSSIEPAVTIQPSYQKLGPNPCSILCSTCNTFGTTRMTHTPNLQTHIAAGILCLIGWCCCACIIPYCTNSCRTGNHYCSQCNAFLGTHNSRIIG